MFCDLGRAWLLVSLLHTAYFICPALCLCAHTIALQIPGSYLHPQDEPSLTGAESRSRRDLQNVCLGLCSRHPLYWEQPLDFLSGNASPPLSPVSMQRW